MRIKPLPGAVALSLVTPASQAQQNMDHSGHAGHAAPAAHEHRDHGRTDGHMDHGSMAHPPGQEPRTPIPAISDADRAAAFPSLPAHHMH